MKIEVDVFKGILPKLAVDKLPNEMAQVAQDVQVTSGALSALRRSTPDVVLGGSSYKTLFEYNEGGNTHWIYYDLIVHWARSPAANDIFERVYLTGADSVNGKYVALVNDIQGGGDFDFTTDFYYPGAPSPAALVADNYSTNSNYRAYFYTNVSRYGEEGPPSALTEITDYDTGTVDLNGFVEPADADEHLKTVIGANAPAIRIYRTSDDGAGNAAFLLVAEVAVDNTGPASTAWAAYEYVDSVTDANLGAVCSSVFYDRCPDDLTNLRPHPNGFFVASLGNTLYFSEPSHPYAWPEDYQISIDAQIVGIGVFGSTIVVATDGNLYTFSGPHPTSLYKTRLSFQPCQSQRAVIETDEGVMFPSPEGFQHVTSSGIANITGDFFKPADWDDYELDTMHGVWYNKAYYGFYRSNDFEGHIVIDLLNGAITTGVGYHWAGYVSISGGIFRTIYPSDLTDASVLYISQWDADPTKYINYTFKSKQYLLSKPHNFKVAQVIIDTAFYNDILTLIGEDNTLVDLNQAAWDAGDELRSSLNGFMFNELPVNGDTLYDLGSLGVQSYVNFKIFVDGTLKFTKQISESNMFKLPRGFKNKKWEWSVDGMIPVKRVILATSTEEIV